MAHSDIHQAGLFSVLQKTLGGIDFRWLGLGLGAVVSAGLVFALLVDSDLSKILLTTVMTLLVMSGALAIAGLAAGVIRLSPETGLALSGSPLSDKLPEGVLVTDQNGDVVYANDACKALMANRDDGRIVNIEEFFSGEVAAAEPVYRLMQAVRDGRGWREEFRVANTCGTEGQHGSTARWYRISVARHLARSKTGESVSGFLDRFYGKEEQNHPLNIWQIAEITSERQRQEEAFGKLQEIIDYLDQAPAGFFSADDKGQIDYMNATLAAWLGLDLADAIASRLTLEDIISGDGAALLSRGFGTTGGETRQTFDLDLIRQDGTSLPVRLLHQSFYDEVRGQQSRTLVLNREPGTGRADDLRAAEVRFARFYQSAPIAIATIDEKGMVGSTNVAFARMFAKTLAGGDSSGIELVSLVEEDNREEVALAFERASAGQVKISPINVSFAGGEKTGRLYFSPAGSIDHESGSEFGGSILYAIDTTDQRSMEMQMVQGQKMQAVGQLAGGIAHDFNNVLTAIILGTDELLGSIRPTDPGFKDIISIKQNANRAASLVRQILAFSRRQTLRPEVLNLNDVVSNLSILLDRLLSDNVKLNLERYRDLWLVKADVIQFEQVIVNLAVNARDAMPAGGTVTITTRNITQRMSADIEDQGMQVGEYVLIQVADTGSGMTQEVRDKVFEPFFTTKGVGKGTGLGLSMVYGIVKQTGGFIYIDSEVGEGTTFRIYLPRHEEDAGETAEKLSSGAEGDKKNKPDLTGTETILLVEDEEAVRGFSARALRKRGYEVFEAGTGVQALEIMNEVDGRIDLVVSDVMMPEMDGPTMAREMRATKPDLKIIFVSGFAREVLDEDDDFVFMAKPYGLKDLAARVKEVLAN